MLQSLLRLEIDQLQGDDVVRLATATVDIEGQMAGNPPVDGAGRIEHERARPSDEAAGFVVVASLHNIDLFAQCRSLADDLPCLPWRGRIPRNHGEAVAVLTEDATPPAVFAAVFPCDVVAGGLPG